MWRMSERRDAKTRADVCVAVARCAHVMVRHHLRGHVKLLTELPVVLSGAERAVAEDACRHAHAQRPHVGVEFVLFARESLRRHEVHGPPEARARRFALGDLPARTAGRRGRGGQWSAVVSSWGAWRQRSFCLPPSRAPRFFAPAYARHARYLVLQVSNLFYVLTLMRTLQLSMLTL